MSFTSDQLAVSVSLSANILRWLLWPSGGNSKGVNATTGLAPRGRASSSDTRLFILHSQAERSETSCGKVKICTRGTYEERIEEIEGERDRGGEGEQTDSSSSLWSDKKMTAFLWSSLCPPWAETSLVGKRPVRHS